MIITAEVIGYIPVNAYIFADDNTRRGFLIDPGAEEGRLLRLIEDNGIVVEKILLTHGHFDHMGAAEALSQKLGVPVCMRREGRRYAEDPMWNLSALCGREIRLKDVTYLEDDGYVALEEDENFRLKVIPLPGHTLDGAVYYAEREKTAFVGDSVFKGSYGRTDFFGGDEAALLQNIVEKILSLPSDTVLCSGHSDPTTVEAESGRPYFARMKR